MAIWEVVQAEIRRVDQNDFVDFWNAICDLISPDRLRSGEKRTRQGREYKSPAATQNVTAIGRRELRVACHFVLPARLYCPRGVIRRNAESGRPLPLEVEA
jgi:hypothetical protein